MTPERHFRVWVARATPREPIHGAGNDAGALAAWFEAGYPAVVCRSDGQSPAGALAVGILLPPRGRGRGRPVPCRVEAAAARRVEPPMALAEVAACAEARWRRAIESLVQVGERFGGFRVYGSHMWQTVTGRRYVRDVSDIDLWIQVRSRGAPAEIGTALCAWGRETGLNADGEFIFPGGAAVSWKEYHTGKGRTVLVKRIASVELAAREELLDAVPD